MYGIGGRTGKHPYRSIYSFIGLVILLSLVPLYRAPSVVAQSFDKVDVEFDFEEVTQNIQVGPGDPCMVQFKGKVRVVTFIPQGRQILVNLTRKLVNIETSGPTQGGWVASISPPNLIFDPTFKENEITVTVRCEQFEYMNAMYQIIIGGQWQNNPGSSGNVVPFTLTTVAAQYSMLRINSPHSFITGYPGENREYTLQIKNDGNGIDWFEVKFINLNPLVDTGFVLVYDTKKTEMIRPGETANFTFNVIGPRSLFVPWRSRISEVSIDVSSVSAEKQGSQEKMSYSVFYQEKGTYYELPLCVAVMSIISILLLLPFYLYKRIVRKHRIRLEVIRSLEEEGLI